MPRFAELTKETMTDAQEKAYEGIVSGPRGGARGPFNILLRSPELADTVQRVGAYLRFKSSMPPRLNEFAICINARFWESKYEWYAHSKLALEAGLPTGHLDALVARTRPAGMTPEEAVVYDFCTTLHQKHFVDDALFERTKQAFGEQGVVDLIGVSGYYTIVSMVLNVGEVPLPEGVPSPW